jgi:hypothetical protein
MKTDSKLHLALGTAMISAACFILFSSLPAEAASFKCKGPDGRVEYSDRACEATKDTLDGPKKPSAPSSRPVVSPMEQLEKLFVDFEPRLCEREALSAEIDRANRAGKFKADSPEWKPKSDRLFELNEARVDFTSRTNKIIQPTSRDSAERAAVLKFQLTLKNCDRPQQKVVETNPAAGAQTASAKPMPVSRPTK